MKDTCSCESLSNIFESMMCLSKNECTIIKKYRLLDKKDQQFVKDVVCGLLPIKTENKN